MSDMIQLLQQIADNTAKDKMDVAMFAVQLGIVGAAIWYSVETRALRMQNLSEIRLLTKQGRLSLAPFLVPGAHKLTKEELEEMIDADERATAEEKQKRKMDARKEEVFFIVQVDNPSDKVGSRLYPYIYDPLTKSFLTPDHGKEWIKPRDKESFQVTGPYFTREQVVEEIKARYGDTVSSLLTEFETPKDYGYLALFFQDIEGTIYLSKRPFVLQEGKVLHHRPARLLCSVA